MRVLVRMAAGVACLSVLGTLWFVTVIAAAGRMQPILATGLLGVLTVIGWAVTLVVGPIAAVQLWRFRESGRRAGLVLFGSGVAYYIVGWFGLRSPQASALSCAVATTWFALPLVVLLLPRTRMLFVQASSNAEP